MPNHKHSSPPLNAAAQEWGGYLTNRSSFYKVSGVSPETLAAWKEGSRLPNPERMESLMKDLKLRWDGTDPVSKKFQGTWQLACDQLTPDQQGYAFTEAPREKPKTQVIKLKLPAEIAAQSVHDLAERNPYSFHHFLESYRLAQELSYADIDGAITGNRQQRFYGQLVHGQNFTSLNKLRDVLRILKIDISDLEFLHPDGGKEPAPNHALRLFIENFIDRDQGVNTVYQSLPKSYWKQVLRDSKDFGTYVTACRYILGYDQEQFAKLCGYSGTSRLSAIESNDYNLLLDLHAKPLDVAQRLTAAFDKAGYEELHASGYGKEDLLRFAGETSNLQHSLLGSRLRQIRPNRETVTACVEEVLGRSHAGSIVDSRAFNSSSQSPQPL